MSNEQEQMSPESEQSVPSKEELGINLVLADNAEVVGYDEKAGTVSVQVEGKEPIVMDYRELRARQVKMWSGESESERPIRELRRIQGRAETQPDEEEGADT